jgi:ectoine hydroxylase
MKFFDKYTGILRSLKIVYVINNILNVKKLSHNKLLYKKFGIRKFIFSNISSNDFAKKDRDNNWLDKPDARQKLEENPILHSFTEEVQESIKKWSENGFMILPNFFRSAKADSINNEIDNLLLQKKVDFNYSNKKIMFAFHDSETIKDIVYNPELLKILNFVLGREVLPFQSINFLKGSEQKAHSDSIHMCTYPLGNLIAAWIALEDTNINNGPLFYYKGSHRLPYVLNGNYNTGNTRFTIGEYAYKNYEDKIEEVIKENHLQKIDFYAKKGDVFIWHANLLHGGSQVIDKNATRKSMVIHYFAKDVICYHEITQRPALFNSHPLASVQATDED